MVPYFPQPVWSVGPFTIHAFGVAVSIALVLSYALTLHRAPSLGIKSATAGTVFVAAALSGLACARILAQGQGMSEIGLALGSLFVVGVTAWRQKTWNILDLFAYVFPFQLAIARTGCFLAHDHVGKLTSNWLGVQFPEGTRFDLGLLYALSACSIAVVAFRLAKWQRLPPGLLFGVVSALLSTTKLLILRLRDSGLP